MGYEPRRSLAKFVLALITVSLTVLGGIDLKSQTAALASACNPDRTNGSYGPLHDAAWVNPTGGPLGGIYGTIVNQLPYLSPGQATNSGWVMLQVYKHGNEYAQAGWYQQSSSQEVMWAEAFGGALSNPWDYYGNAAPVGSGTTYSVQTTGNGTFTFWENGVYMSQVFAGFDTSGYDTASVGDFATEVHNTGSEMAGGRADQEAFSGLNVWYNGGWKPFGWATTQKDEGYYGFSQNSAQSGQTWDEYCPYSNWPAVIYDSSRTQQAIYWNTASEAGWEGWWTPSGGWNNPGSSMNFGTMGSPPVVIFDPTQNQEVVFWQGTNNQLWEAFYGGSWSSPSQVTSLSGGGTMASAPAALYDTNQQQQVVFWTGTDGNLYETWWQAGVWVTPTEVKTSQGGHMGPLGSAPSAAFDSANGQQVVFWRGADANLWEAFWNGNWNGPGFNNVNGSITSRPSVAFDSYQNQQIVFWQGTSSDNPQFTLHEEYFTDHWNGPFTVSGMGTLGSAPTVAFDSASNQQLIFWKGGTNLYETFWQSSNGWNGPSDITPYDGLLG